MTESSPTVGELFKAKPVTDEQVSAAVEAYLADLTRAAHQIARGYNINKTADRAALWQTAALSVLTLQATRPHTS